MDTPFRAFSATFVRRHGAGPIRLGHTVNSAAGYSAVVRRRQIEPGRDRDVYALVVHRCEARVDHLDQWGTCRRDPHERP